MKNDRRRGNRGSPPAVDRTTALPIMTDGIDDYEAYIADFEEDLARAIKKKSELFSMRSIDFQAKDYVVLGSRVLRQGLLDRDINGLFNLQESISTGKWLHHERHISCRCVAFNTQETFAKEAVLIVQEGVLAMKKCFDNEDDEDDDEGELECPRKRGLRDHCYLNEGNTMHS